MTNQPDRERALVLVREFGGDRMSHEYGGIIADAILEAQALEAETLAGRFALPSHPHIDPSGRMIKRAQELRAQKSDAGKEK